MIQERFESIAEVVKEGYHDYTAMDPNSDHPDPKSTESHPRWFMVDLKFKQKFDTIISLQELKQYDELMGMQLLKKGNRLSVMPVEANHWDFIINLSQ